MNTLAAQTNGIRQMAKKLGGTISKNSPAILTGAAVAGLITTAIFAVRATPKALEILDEELYERLGDDMYGESGNTTIERVALLSNTDIVKLTWRCYVPACAVALASIGCIVGANTIHSRRTAALASVYSLTETAFKEYKTKVAETIGKNKEQKVRDEISADHVRANPPGANEVIITGKGETLCMDNYSGRYFKHNIEDLRRIENKLNKLLLYEDSITLNELYIDLGLAPNKMGDDLGWSIQTGMLEFRFSSQLTPESDEPCLVLDYEIRPLFLR